MDNFSNIAGMSNVKGHFAAYPYGRDHKQVVPVARRGASGDDTVIRDADSGGGEYRVRTSGESRPADTSAVQAGGQVLDEEAKRAARDKRIDELMTVIEALHGDTLAELAK